ncbi:F-box/FBD/LRR-repeat protein At5g56420-like [Quercus robur]|uniref:F-box/FBD/LRR-repeat protein At5g56420-like n=1 Tax=Quercus robur TaxID=38942 RepID=UPI002163D3B3|nr:F-box/FBD/LRR-repeat protein At5g56420-like [Quercus robur]
MNMSGQRRRIERAESCLSSVRQKSLTNTDADIISTLPDFLLSHILSLLPTKDAVITSTLSSRWRPVWTLVPLLDLDEDQLFRTQNQTFRFPEIVSRIFILRNTVLNPTPIHKLRIRCFNNCVPLHIDTWVRATFRHRVQELDLSICTDPNEPLELPRSVYFCSTLVVLKLEGNFNILINPPSACEFPSLRILELRNVKFANSDSLSTLLNACTVLQDLTLNANFTNLDNFNLIVLIDTLKTLDLRVESSSYKVHINTPALEYFSFSGPLGEDVVLENLPNLDDTLIDIDVQHGVSIQDYAKRVRDFMRPLSNIVDMELCIEVVEILYNASSHDDIPMFHNLNSLSLFGFHYFEWRVVQVLLHRTPKLQVLVFDLSADRSRSAIDGCLQKLQDVPECLSSHLTACHYRELSGNEIEMELVRQILKAARVLKTMRISVEDTLDSEVKLRVCEEISKYQRSSHFCQIAFD